MQSSERSSDTDSATAIDLVAPPPIARPRTIEAVYRALADYDRTWAVEIGRPDDAGWIHGEQLACAGAGPFLDLLTRIGARMQSGDRRTIAASFLLRFGWASGMAIAPFVLFRAVPDVRLSNVSFKFKESTFFERAALHTASGLLLADEPTDAVNAAAAAAAADADADADVNAASASAASAAHRRVAAVAQADSTAALLRHLGETLHQQAAPVLDALYAWSGFSRRGAWGLLTSSWASQFTTVCGRAGAQTAAGPLLDALFAGADADVARMRPQMHPVTCGETTHLFQRRSSCCRYYLLPQGDLCASCPLVSHAQRLEMNRSWLEELLTRERARVSH